MDSESSSKHSVVLHRIRHHSLTGIPIPGISADGIGSPTDHAHTPPGVLIKIDSIHHITKKVSCEGNSPTPAKKMICKNCSKKINCRCKKCTLEKLGLYSRRENLTMRFEEKERLQAEMAEILGPSEGIKNQITEKEEKLMSLRVAVENAKMRIAMKQSEISKLDGSQPVKASQFTTVFDSHSRFFAKTINDKKEKRAKLEKRELEVAKIRLQYCVVACRIFPVQIYDVNVESVTSKMKNSKNWAMVNDSELQKGLRIAIRHSYINDKLRAKLASQLSNGPISLPLELHPPFAAFTNTLQLIHLLSVIFNFLPPESLSHHDLCIRDRWSKDSLNRDWATLCDAVLYLCVFIGMPIKVLKYQEPHQNLIALASFVVNEQNNIQRIGSRPMCDLAEVHALIASQRPKEHQKKDDVDDSWIFVE